MKCNNCESIKYFPFMKTKCPYTGVNLTAVKCSICDLVFLNPRPNKELGKEYFDNAYSNSEGFENHSYYRDHDKIIKRNNNRFEWINKIDSPEKTILDFGAGQGYFMKVCGDNGWQVTGVEQSEEGIKSAKKLFGIEIEHSLANMKGKKFGVITLWDVIEHLEDPKSILLMLTEYLNEDGYFVLETSNINSYGFLIEKKEWGYWNVDHFFYFSDITLKYLLESIGFEIVKVQPNNIAIIETNRSNINKYFNINHLMNFKQSTKIVWNKVKLKYYKSKYKNTSSNDLMTVVARKKTTKKNI